MLSIVIYYLMNTIYKQFAAHCVSSPKIRYIQKYKIFHFQFL